MINVKLLLTNRQRGEDGEESVVKAAQTAQFGAAGSDGKYSPKKGQSYYILYDEITEEGAVCKNVIKLQDSMLELTKRGAGTQPQTRMVFWPGKICNVNYPTPYGCLQMEVSTRQVKVFFEEDLPQILAEYTLTSEGRLISHCLLEVKLKPL